MKKKSEGLSITAIILLVSLAFVGIGTATPVAPTEQVVEPIAPVTPQATATPAPVLGVLAALGAAAVLLKRRQ